MPRHIRKGDTVIVTKGASKGVVGEVLLSVILPPHGIILRILLKMNALDLRQQVNVRTSSFLGSSTTITPMAATVNPTVSSIANALWKSIPIY